MASTRPAGKLRATSKISADASHDDRSDGSAKSAQDASSKKGQTGLLKIGTYPVCKITVDGEDYGWTPNPKIVLPVGKHRLNLSNPQFNIDDTTVIDIKPGPEPTFVSKDYLRTEGGDRDTTE